MLVRRNSSGTRPVGTIALFAIFVTGLAGCVPPPNNPGGPQYQPAPMAAPQQPARIDPTGRWCFKDDKGHNAMNYIERAQGGIVASPIGRKGREAFYADAGPNLYRAGNGATYEFYNDNQAVWRHGRKVWPHRRCG